MPLDRFKLILESWSLNYRQAQISPADTARNFSGVNLDHYVHGWDLEEHRPDRSCRDIRYKADSAATDLWNSTNGESESSERRVVRILKDGGFADPTYFSELEIGHIVDLFDRADGKCEQLSDLIALWQSDLPGQAGLEVERAAAPVVSPAEPLLPTDREGIRKLLWPLAQKLPGHVARRFSTYLPNVLDSIESRPPEIRIRVVSELYESLQNESGLLNNNMKEDQMMIWLESIERDSE